ncbi:putative bifunctional methylthioribulose-1-phosphate dehydratase/enolase-phosphatase E1 [Nymphaea thermarum]|nr:putative bifunctional methylthioribulose-1-phosphate dehydratase/enolase-phosphatase E1 [Nymphaea thermarum]
MGSTDLALLSSEAYLEGSNVKEARGLVSELCRHFYTLGWVSGTGGSITVKVHDDAVPKNQQLLEFRRKEWFPRICMYYLQTVLSCQRLLKSPTRISHQNAVNAYQMRNAGAVIHSHGIECVLATLLHPSEKEFRITHMEMIKGIQGHGYYDELVIPIVENTAREGELTDSLAEAIAAYPKATAVLVRNHGIYVWGDSWISAKTQAECYHYLFDAAFKLHQMGRDWSSPSHGPIKELGTVASYPNHINGLQMPVKRDNEAGNPHWSCILLDIEGTTTPISFVADVLFPYARHNVRKHLTNTYESKDTQEDIKLLRAQVKEDLEQGVSDSVSIPSEDAGKEDIIDSLVANVEAMIKADRKITALKQLQGHIWRTGYENNELKGVFFEDVPKALAQWHAMGVKIYIYSSGSREAQRLIFGNTAYEIYQSLGVDKPSQILFVTDVIQEAEAASSAGLDVVISVRPGNALLPEGHKFRTIRSFEEI